MIDDQRVYSCPAADSQLNSLSCKAQRRISQVTSHHRDAVSAVLGEQLVEGGAGAGQDDELVGRGVREERVGYCLADSCRVGVSNAGFALSFVKLLKICGPREPLRSSSAQSRPNQNAKATERERETTYPSKPRSKSQPSPLPLPSLQRPCCSIQPYLSLFPPNIPNRKWIGYSAQSAILITTTTNNSQVKRRIHRTGCPKTKNPVQINFRPLLRAQHL